MLLRELVNSVPQESAFEGYGVHEYRLVFKNHFLKALRASNPIMQMRQKISLAEQETPHEGKNHCMISGSYISLAGQKGGFYVQGTNVQEQSSARLETGHCYFRQQERLQADQYQQMTKENTGPMLVEVGRVASEDVGKIKALNAFFFSL